MGDGYNLLADIILILQRNTFEAQLAQVRKIHKNLLFYAKINYDL